LRSHLDGPKTVSPLFSVEQRDVREGRRTAPQLDPDCEAQLAHRTVENLQRRSRPVAATASLNTCDGVIHPRVCRGLPLSSRAMASSCACLCTEGSLALGKY
jgi:hypothetical protein